MKTKVLLTKEEVTFLYWAFVEYDFTDYLAKEDVDFNLNKLVSLLFKLEVAMIKFTKKRAEENEENTETLKEKIKALENMVEQLTNETTKKRGKNGN